MAQTLAHTSVLFFLMLLVFGIIAVFTAVFAVKIWIPFFDKRKYIKMEIERSEDEEEREYWQIELKLLYFGAVPFVKSIFFKNHD